MAPPTAIVTGACSGIGLALTKYLLAHSWNVVMADLNPSPETLEDTKFIKTDVASWDSQAALFAEAYAWNGRLDFAALNAGIADRDDIFQTLSKDPNKPPARPNMKPFDVNLSAVYYGIKLAAHYMTVDSSAAGKPQTGGKIVATASSAGIWGMPGSPQYGATKHGVVGLVKSIGGNPEGAQAQEIRINSLCPGFVSTNILTQEAWNAMPQHVIIPMATIMEAFEKMALLQNVAQPDWVKQGPTGKALIVQEQGLFWQEPYPFVGLSNVQDTMAAGAVMRASLKVDNVRWAQESEKGSYPSRI